MLKTTRLDIYPKEGRSWCTRYLYGPQEEKEKFKEECQKKGIPFQESRAVIII